MCFVWIWKQTAIISLYSINWLVCITETECVYCAVRTGCLPVYTGWMIKHRSTWRNAQCSSQQLTAPPERVVGVSAAVLGGKEGQIDRTQLCLAFKKQKRYNQEDRRTTAGTESGDKVKVIGNRPARRNSRLANSDNRCTLRDGWPSEW
jgi:hypothetical protein